MSTVWTAERDQRLLVLLIDQLNLGGCDKIAEAWKAKYTGVDSYQPTARAISEHVKALKKAAGGTTNAAGMPKKTPATPAKATPKRPTQAKTPTTSGKRSRSKANSDEDEEPMTDDSEPDHKTLKTMKLAPRSTLSRRSKSATAETKSYLLSDSEADAEVEEGAGIPQVDGAADEMALETPKKGVRGLAEGKITPQGKVAQAVGGKTASVDGGDESDVSSFSAGFGA